MFAIIWWNKVISQHLTFGESLLPCERGCECVRAHDQRQTNANKFCAKQKKRLETEYAKMLPTMLTWQNGKTATAAVKP